MDDRTTRLGKNAARESRRRKASLKPAGSRWSGVAPFRYDHGVRVCLNFMIRPLAETPRRKECGGRSENFYHKPTRTNTNDKRMVNREFVRLVWFVVKKINNLMATNVTPYNHVQSFALR